MRSPTIQTNRRFFAAFLSGLLILQLALPFSAHDRCSQELAEGNGAASFSRSQALRETSPDQGSQKTGLEEQLLSAGLEEAPNEEDLMAYIAEHSARARLRYKEGDRWHSHRKNFNDAVGDQKAQQLISYLDASAVEIYGIPDGLIQNRGAFYNEGLGILFLGEMVLRTADVPLIRFALQGNPNPLQQWAGRHQAGERSFKRSAPRPMEGSVPAKPVAVGTIPGPPLEESPLPASDAPAWVPLPPPAFRIPDLHAIRGAIVKTAQDLFAGRLVPNTVGMMSHATDDSVFSVWVDVTDSQVPGIGFLSFSGEPQAMPLIPDPHERRGDPSFRSAGRYRARVKKQEWGQALLDRHPNIGPLMIAASQDLNLLLARSEDEKRNWVSGLIPPIRQAVGKNSGHLAAVHKQEERSVEVILQAVGDLYERHRELNRRILQVTAELSASSQEGQTAMGPLRSALNLLREAASPWARAEHLLRQYEQTLPLEAAAREPLQSHLDFIRKALPERARQRDLLTLFEQTGRSPLLGELYYDACRAVWLGKVEELESRLSSVKGAQLDESVMEIFQLAQWVVSLEQEAALTDVVRKKMAFLNARETVTNLAAQGVGILFLDSETRPRRFVPGGGAVVLPRRMGGSYFPFRVEQWVQPGDRLVLIQPSLTGIPNVEQLYLFMEERLELEKALPGAPEIWLGTVTPEGVFRLYRPTALSADEEGWIQAENEVADQMVRFEAFQLFMKRNVFTPDVPEAQAPDVRAIARAHGKRLPGRQVVKRAVGSFDPVERWMRDRASDLPQVVEKGIKETYGADAADQVMGIVQARFQRKFNELQRKRGDFNYLNRNLLALAHRSQMLIGEIVAAPLVEEGELFTQVHIEGLTEAGFPSLAQPGQEAAEEEAQSRPEDPEGQVRKELEALRGRAVKGQGWNEEQLLLFEEGWIPEAVQLMATHGRLRQSDYNKAFKDSRRLTPLQKAEQEIEHLSQVDFSDSQKTQQALEKSGQLLSSLEIDSPLRDRLQESRETLAELFAEGVLESLVGQADSKAKPGDEEVNALVSRLDAAAAVVQGFPSASRQLQSKKAEMQRTARGARRQEQESALYAQQQKLRLVLEGGASPQETAGALLASEFEGVLSQDRVSRGFLEEIAQSGVAFGKRLEKAKRTIAAHSEHARTDPVANRFYQALQGLVNRVDTKEAGLEETEQTKAINAYREKVEAVERKMKELNVQTDLRPGEVWMLAQLAGPQGYVPLAAVDQPLAKWIPDFDSDNPDLQIRWNVRYRMGIAALFQRLIKEIQKQSSWRRFQGLFQGEVGFLFSALMMEHDEFRQLRADWMRVPEAIRRNLPQGATLKGVLFLAQGEDPDAPRWSGAQVGMTVEEAIRSGAIGYKTNVMLPAMPKLPGRSYHAHWGRLLEKNLEWVKQQAQETRSAMDGNGVGYVASALIWAAPPRGFVPGSDPKLAKELAKEEPADWAIKEQMEAWLLSEEEEEKETEKEKVEASEEFALAHQELTERVVQEWSQTPGVTLIMIAGPYFAQTEEEWTQRSQRAREAIQKLAAIGHGRAKGRVIPLSRNRSPEVVKAELEVMAEEKLPGGFSVGRTVLSSFVNPETKKFYRIQNHLFGQKATMAVTDLLGTLAMLGEKQSTTVWEAYGISPAQAAQMVQAGLEEESILKEVKEAMAKEEKLPVRIKVQPTEKTVSVQVVYEGARGQHIDGFIPMSLFIHDPQKSMSLSQKRRFLMNLQDTTVYAQPINIQTGDKPEVIFALNWSISELNQTLEEIKQSIRQGNRLPISIQKVREDGMGAAAEFRSKAGIPMRGYIHPSRVFDDPRPVSIALKMAWLKVHEGKILQAIPIDLQGTGYAPQIIFALDVSTGPALDELEKARADDKTVDVVVVGLDPNRVGARVFYLGENGWLRGYLPVSNVFKENRDLREHTRRTWLTLHLGEVFPAKVEEVHRGQDGPEAIFRLHVPIGELEREIGPALRRLKQIKNSRQPIPVVIQEVDGKKGGAVVVYKQDESWINGFIPFGLVSEGEGVSTQMRREWLKRNEGKPVEATLMKMDPSRFPPNLIFALNLPASEFRTESGLEERTVEERDRELLDFALEDESYRLELGTPNGAVFDQADGSKVSIVKIGQLSFDGVLYIQQGVNRPKGLPGNVKVDDSIGTEIGAVLQRWEDSPPPKGSVFLWNDRIVGQEAAAWMPQGGQDLAPIIVDPEFPGGLSADGLASSVHWAREAWRVGNILEIRSITFHEVGDELYAVIRAA